MLNEKVWVYGFIGFHAFLKGLEEVRRDEFAKVIDALEKENNKWGNSVRYRQKYQTFESAISSHDYDSVCAVCLFGICYDGNQIVYCDGCDIPVHQGIVTST